MPTCIVTGHKPIEYRSYPTKHRGWLLIHAGMLTMRYRSAIISLPRTNELVRGEHKSRGNTLPRTSSGEPS